MLRSRFLVYPEKLMNAWLAAFRAVVDASPVAFLSVLGTVSSNLLAMGIKTNRHLNPEPQAETSIDSSATTIFHA